MSAAALVAVLVALPPVRLEPVVGEALAVRQAGDSPRGERALAADPLLLDPEALPRAQPGRWAGLFDGRNVVPEKLPRDVGPLVQLAREHYARRDYAGAIDVLFALLEREPDFPPSLLELGTSYFRLRRYGDTIVCLERFLEVAPGQVFRTQVLAHAYYSVGRHERARDHYRAVLAELPESVEAVRGLALSHYRLGDPDAALEWLDRVIALRSDHAEAWTWKAQILYEEERSDEALGVAERARDLDRYSPKPWYLLSRILSDLGRQAESDAAAKEWTELDRLTQEVRAIEGQLLFRPDDHGLALRLAQVQQEIGDAVGTRAALARALRTRPAGVSELALRIHALDVLVDMNDEAGAALAAEELATRCASEPAAWKRLHLYYARIGDTERQALAGERYLRLESE